MAWVVGVLSMMVAGWASVSSLRRRRFDDPLFYAVAVLELVVVVQLVLGVVALSGTSRDVDAVTFVSYLVTAVALPPAAVLWSASDPSRWGTAVITVMGVGEAVLAIRLLDIWSAGSG